MKSVLIGAGIVVVTLLIMVITTVAIRWYLALNDLPTYAKPSGFDEVAYRRQCPNAGGSCSQSWLYISEARTSDDALRELAVGFKDDGWKVTGCEPDTCQFNASRLGACFAFRDFRRDHDRSPNDRKWWEQEFANGQVAVEAIRIHRSDCG